MKLKRILFFPLSFLSRRLVSPKFCEGGSNIFLAVLCVGGLLFPFMPWCIPGSFLSADTIIDSVYSIGPLDGYIAFELPTEIFVVNNWMYELNTGDQMLNGMGGPQIPNTHFRSYLTFSLPEIPVGYDIDSVNVRLYQWISHGNLNYLGFPQSDFPIWDVAGGDTIKCIMSHIDYGYELDSLDWSKGDHGNPYTYNHNIGTITESGEDGYRYLDVTDCVLQDYTMGRDITQYRIAFQINTDWDDLADQVGFTSYETSVINEAPQLFFYLSNGAGIGNVLENKNSMNCRIFPNPFNPTTTISFNLTTEITEDTELVIYNVKGQKVDELVISSQQSEVSWNAKNQASGIYFIILKNESRVICSKKITLMK
ncbi:MAG: T9SS type A sorting domain-containing protein [Armatimonadetes bacterium]|nr:T9SS type A sorting domain-containing protein [Armatimonadota bacterium]